MIKRNFSRPFRRLRGKLTLTYTITTVVTLLLVEIFVIGLALGISAFYVSYFALNVLKQDALHGPPYFIHSQPDRAELSAWLQSENDNFASKQGPFNFSRPVFLAVVDTQGQILASVGSHSLPINTPMQAQLPVKNGADLKAVLHGTSGITSKIDVAPDHSLIASASIVRKDGSIAGALVMDLVPPDDFQLIISFLQFLLLSAIFISIVAAVTGLISGYITARNFTNRLKGLSTVVDWWGKGDLSAAMYDPSEDELGQAMRQLNQMASQLQNLLQARQKLAMLEERNRLARDLHDSIKQQVFAISMQIGAAKFLLRNDADAADKRLDEADKLAHQAQQELTSLIRELRPVALEGKGLSAALRDLTTSWAGQTDIVANVRIEGTLPLPLTVEEALFRVAQEALSNVARHSKAQLVQVDLVITEEIVTLSIIDNGQGFHSDAPTSPGVGLLSMQERMRAFGGEARIESNPGGGTSIIAHCKRLGIGGSIQIPVNN